MFVGGSLLSLRRAQRTRPGAMAAAAYLIGPVVVFCRQVRHGLRLIGDEGADGALEANAILVIVCFLIGISRSWEPIGGPSIGLVGELRKAMRPRDEPAGRGGQPSRSAMAIASGAVWAKPCRA